MRRIVAHLDAEAELARHHPRTPSPPATGRRALETAAGLGSLLRILGADGDRLWLPAPLDPSRLPHLEGMAEVVVEHGPLSELAPAGRTLAWCETPAVAALRHRDGEEAGPPGDDQELLWQLPAPPPEVVARVHHRGFSHRLARALGCALPGARTVATVEELEAHLAAGGSRAGRYGAWVVKAPLAASGRMRYVAPEPALPSAKARRTVANLLARHGTLLFEPWLARRADYAVTAVVLPGGAVRTLSVHRQEVDRHGRLVADLLPRRFDGFAAAARTVGLAGAEASRLAGVVTAAGRALGRAGFVGPFGIDAFHHTDAGGVRRFHPLVEVNARMTFGLVARAVVDRLAAGGGADALIRLAFGPGEPPAGATQLVAPDSGRSGAWLAADPPG